MAAPKEKSQVITAFVMDFETGGLDCKKCAATQISVHAIRLDNFEVMGTFTKYIYPYQSKPDIGKPKRKVLRNKYDEEEEQPTLEYGKVALEYSAITMDMLYDKGEELEAVCNDLIDFFKQYTLTTSRKLKPIFVGQNILFDLGFLQQIMTYCGLWKEVAKIFRGSEDFFGNFHDLIRLHTACETLPRIKRKWQMFKRIGERLGTENRFAWICAEANIVFPAPIGAEVDVAAAALHIDGS